MGRASNPGWPNSPLCFLQQTLNPAFLSQQQLISFSLSVLSPFDENKAGSCGTVLIFPSQGIALSQTIPLARSLWNGVTNRSIAFSTAQPLCCARLGVLLQVCMSLLGAGCGLEYRKPLTQQPQYPAL